MGRLTRTAVVVWSLVGLGGCSAIAGLDSIQEQDCAPNCGSDSGTTRSLDSSAGGDSTSPGDDSASPGPDSATPTPDASNDDTGSGSDSGSGGGDSSTVDDTGTGGDGQVQDSSAPVDAPPVDDAPYDSGCGSLNSTSNCGACGIKCGSTEKSQSTQTATQCCTGSTCPGSTNGAGDSCQYTCATGNLDCNALDPPNTDGCECPYSGVTTAPACCGDQCPTKHTDGLTGQSYYPSSPYFYDCQPAGTAGGMNSTVAQDACLAYVLARGGTNSDCNPFLDSADASVPDSWCAATSPTAGFMGDCICWTFSGSFAGTVADPKVEGATPNVDCYGGFSTSTFN